MGKVIVIGIDAATWRIIDPLLYEGKLPTFASLIKEGVRASLKSLRGYKSPALWTSIATGKLPEKNGVLYFSNLFVDIPQLKVKKDITTSFFVNWPYRIGKFFSRDKKCPSSIMRFSRKAYVYSMLKYGKVLEKLNLGGNYLVTNSFRVEKTMWELLSEEKVSCGVVGWLVTWPADKINGVLVSQRAIDGLSKVYLTSDKFKIKDQGRVTYPESVAGELQRFNLSPLVITPKEIALFFSDLDDLEERQIRSITFDRKNKFNFFAQLYLSDLFSVETGLYLQEKFSPDFLTVYLPGLDGIQHIFWQYHFTNDFCFAGMADNEIRKFKNVISSYYEFLDKQLALLIKHDATVIVISDHGMESIPEKHFDRKAIRSGQHEESPDGILLMKGPALKQGVVLEKAHILDIAPTVLYLMGKNINEGMDGEVLTNAMVSEYLEKHPVAVKNYGKRESKKEALYDKEEEGKVKERLKALGYLD